MPAVDFWVFISSLTGRNFLIVCSAVLILYFLYKKRNKDAVLIFIGSIGGVILNKILKEIFQLPRPSDALIPVGGYTFPSGHAMSAVIFYSMLILLFHKKIKNKVARNSLIFANVLIILLIGLSRVMLKVHYVRDVLAGYIIGLLWLFILYKMLEKTKL
ncbi:MAG: phosphatase PAP2 family protein [Nanoarchaeota archaeon]|nr:phosphatase PAP2 family protein [Nanoarchaeota archaeon]